MPCSYNRYRLIGAGALHAIVFTGPRNSHRGPDVRPHSTPHVQIYNQRQGDLLKACAALERAMEPLHPFWPAGRETIASLRAIAERLTVI